MDTSRTDVDVGEGLFDGLARGTVLHRFAILEKARGNRPVATARLDGTLAQQYLALPLGHAAHNNPRIVVVNRVAGGADETQPLIAGRDARFEHLATVRAEFHAMGDGCLVSAL